MAVRVRWDGAVLEIVLERPDVLNAFDDGMHAGLRDALREARDPAARAVVLTGSGRGFCVGQDLGSFAGDRDVGELLRTTWNRHALALRALEKPVLAAVNGACAGAGLSLACACDLRIATASAAFVPAFVRVGLVPDAGSSWLLARLLGPARAYEWMTSGRRLSSGEALAAGLVSEVVEDERFSARVEERARELAAGPTRALAMYRRLFDAAPLASLEEQLEREAQTQAAAAAGEDFREGVTAFREKREPRFSGS